MTTSRLRNMAFEKRGFVDDGIGGGVTPFVEQFSRWVQYRPRLGGETVLQARLQNRDPANFKLRQDTQTRAVDTDWRARDKDTNEVFNIRSIIDPDRRGKWLEMLTEKGAPG